MSFHFLGLTMLGHLNHLTSRFRLLNCPDFVAPAASDGQLSVLTALHQRPGYSHQRKATAKIMFMRRRREYKTL